MISVNVRANANERFSVSVASLSETIASVKATIASEKGVASEEQR